MCYILDDNNIPVQSTANEHLVWEEKFPEKTAVKQQYIGIIYISTVFLGTSPLWETMIFGVDNDNYKKRYSTYEEALVGHETALNLVKKQVV